MNTGSWGPKLKSCLLRLPNVVNVSMDLFLVTDLFLINLATIPGPFIAIFSRSMCIVATSRVTKDLEQSALGKEAP